MNNQKQQHKKLEKSEENFDMSFKEYAQKMEHKLKFMGIELPRRGPRLSAPGHTRDTIYTDSSSSLLQKGR